MKTKSPLPFIVIVLAIILSSCGKNLIPFTESVMEKFPDNYTELQGYLGPVKEELVLRRLLTSDTSKISEGKIVEKSGKFYNYITITGGTPCKILPSILSSDGFVNGAFRKGNEQVYLPFKSDAGSYFTLNTFEETSTNGKTFIKVLYDGDVYRVMSGNTVVFGLFCDKKQVQSVKHEKTREKGWKVTKSKNNEKANKKKKDRKEAEEEEE